METNNTLGMGEVQILFMNTWWDFLVCFCLFGFVFHTGSHVYQAVPKMTLNSCVPRLHFLNAGIIALYDHT